MKSPAKVVKNICLTKKKFKIMEEIKCKHYCSDNHYCVWSQKTCNIRSDPCVYEYNPYWKKNSDINIQLTINFI